MCIPVLNTTSAQSKSSAVAARTFSSTNRASQVLGRRAATSRMPCGGMNAFTFISGNAWLNVPKE